MKISALRSFLISHFSFLILILLSTFYFLSSAAPTYAAEQAAPTQTIATPLPNTNPDVPPRNPVVTGNVAGTFQPQADYVPNNLHNWTQSVMIEVMSALTCQLAGVDPINPKQPCLGADSATGKIGFLPKTGLPAGASLGLRSHFGEGGAQAGGAIGFMGNMISTLYTPPLHTSDYFKDLASNFGISKKTYAQTTGTGFQSLTPLINIWSAFRNIVYLLLVIVFVVIGLAIMLRVKIDPRTVMTIQNQIPKIIVGILAVTFSFAIAGFLIDMMWVFIYLIYGIFTTIPGVDVSSLNPSVIQGQNAIGIASHITPGGIFGITHNAANSIKDAVQGLLGIKATWTEIFNPLAGITNWFDPTKRGDVLNWAIDTASYITGFIAFKNYTEIVLTMSNMASSAVGWVPLIGGSLKDIANTVILGGGNLASSGLAYATFVGTEAFLRIGLPYVIAYLIIIIAVFVALFRLWFTLIMAYVQILLAVVLAPFWIIGGIVPGSPISLGGWFRNIGANLLAFPTVIAMFMLARVFTDAFGTTPATGQNFVPPLIGNPGDPSLIGSLIGLGIILMTPNIVTMLKAALKTPKADTGIGRAIGTGTGTASAPFKSVMTGVSFVAGQKVAARILPTFLGGRGKEVVSGAAATQAQANAPHVQP